MNLFLFNFFRFLIFILFLSFCTNLFSQKKPSFSSKIIVITSVLNKYHYSPKNIDEDFSEKVMDHFISKLDPDAMFLLAEDVDEISKFKYIFSEGKANEFLTAATLIYKKRLYKTDSVIEGILIKPFIFSQGTVYSFKNKEYLNSEKELEERWEKRLKSQALFRLQDIKSSDQSIAENKSEALSKEAEIRDVLKLINKRKINNILNYQGGLDKLIEFYYLNSIASCFDPHSMFMPLTIKENFLGNVTNIHFSFGFELDENNTGEVVVAHITPGGPAWRSGEINKDDVILKARWSGKEEVDFTAASVDEIQKYFSQENHSKISLLIRKASGLEKMVILEKEKIRNDENFVKSFVLEGEKKIGYITLPGFYTKWEAQEGSGCANDVAKEILKLQKAGIEGLIFDVRDNGGGSLGEAIDLAGIFIDEGPLLFTREKEGKPKAIKDFNRGTIYDGPMVLLVNGHSASASEVLAAVLQDYNRALIIGSPTFGKSTSQVILPMDTSIFGAQKPRSEKKEDDKEYIKVTVEKIYRVNGKTSQFSGVAPHIQLPDLFENIYKHESQYPNAIPVDSIKKSPYYQPLKELPIIELQRKSKQRISENNYFIEAKKCQVSLEEIMNKNLEIPLKLEDFITFYDERKKRLEEINDLFNFELNFFTVKNNVYDIQKFELDELRMELNEKHAKKISSDSQIAEAFNIILDYINLIQ